MSNHAAVLSTDDLLRRFWETSLLGFPPCLLMSDPKTHRRDETGQFIMPLPRKPGVKPLGESKSLAIRRFLSLECSLWSKNNFSDVVEEYFKMGHAEAIPEADLDKPCENLFYLPMHAVMKEFQHHHQGQSCLRCISKVVNGSFTQ